MVAPTEFVFETHSWSEDNDRGIASGWNHSRLSSMGRDLARELGERRKGDGIAAVFTSDLRRSVETVEIAFGDHDAPVFIDWRLRECDYGTGNGMPAAELHVDRAAHLDDPYPGGECWRDAVERCADAVRDIARRWAGERVLVVGHVATRWALDQAFDGRRLEDLVDSDFDWQLGWEYRSSG